MKREGFNYDGVLKDLIQHDRPKLLDRLAGGLAVREFLNVELPKVLDRRVDLVLRLADGSILHIEFQSSNDREMPYREGIYCFLLAQKYRCRIRQVVLYVGQPRMRMVDGVNLGDTKGAYQLLDIREIDAPELLASNRPGDHVLAILGRGGDALVKKIVEQIARLRGPERGRALAQLVILAGLRGLPRRVEWEMKRMGIAADIMKNPVVMKWRREAVREGRAEAKAETLRELLQTKFGRLPKWAAERLDSAATTDVERWLKKVIVADSLEGVLGKKQSLRRGRPHSAVRAQRT